MVPRGSLPSLHPSRAHAQHARTHAHTRLVHIRSCVAGGRGDGEHLRRAPLERAHGRPTGACRALLSPRPLPLSPAPPSLPGPSLSPWATNRCLPGPSLSPAPPSLPGPTCRSLLRLPLPHSSNRAPMPSVLPPHVRCNRGRSANASPCSASTCAPRTSPHTPRSRRPPLSPPTGRCGVPSESC